jgi:hypothetical protein
VIRTVTLHLNDHASPAAWVAVLTQLRDEAHPRAQVRITAPTYGKVSYEITAAWEEKQR